MEDPNFKIPLLPQSELDKVKNKFLDIPYATQSPFQILDIYLPEKGKGPYKTIVHFHGGAFLFGTQRDINLAPMLRVLDHGYALISVQYRMSLEARFPAMLWDAKASIRHLRANAKNYNLDTDNIGVWGPSAGGWIVSMLGVTNGNPAFEDLSMGNPQESSSVQAVVDWCGPAGGFLNMDIQIRENRLGEADHNDPDSPESRFMGAPIETIPELVQMASPIKNIYKDLPPFMIHHGGADPIVPVQQSTDFALALKSADCDVTLEIFPFKGHHGQPWYDEVDMSDKVIAFFDQKLGSK